MHTLLVTLTVLLACTVISASACGGGGGGDGDDDDVGTVPPIGTVEQDPDDVATLKESIRTEYAARGFERRQIDCIIDSLRDELDEVEIGDPLEPHPEIQEAIDAAGRACAETG